MTPHELLDRLDAIARGLATQQDALALIGLGSVGLERERLDAYSDLDFFVIVDAGCRRRYLDDLAWLESAGQIAYAFANTAEGYKALYADGILCEFAVFEPELLRTVPFAPGRVVWKRADVPESIGHPATVPATSASRSADWLVGEALTNLYVGLGRERRGERLSAMRFIQGYAVDRIVELAARLETAQPVAADPFTPERRFEQRFPGLASEAAGWLQGYNRNRDSALAILAFLERHAPVNTAMAAAIRALCGS